jgi:hypothetical protein
MQIEQIFSGWSMVEIQQAFSSLQTQLVTNEDAYIFQTSIAMK